MKFAVLYDKNKTYYTKDGKVVDEKTFETMYPASKHITMALIVFDDNVIDDVNALSYYLDKYKVKSDDIERQLIEVTNYINSEEDESTPIERIASALEFIAMSMNPLKE